MDGRPQRPLRGTRVLPDENAPPQGSSKQTIHQRHKSTGTLSNMTIAGGLKAAAKRTAFGDVSNTAKTLVAAHDDSAIVGKQYQVDNVKPAAHDKSAAFARPAQRPAGLATSKITSTNDSHNEYAVNGASLPLVQGHKQAYPINRAQPKKVASVYKDPESDNVQPQGGHGQLPRQDLAPVAPVHQSLGPRQHKSQSQLPQMHSSMQPPQNEPPYDLIHTSETTSDSNYEDAPEQMVGPREAGFQPLPKQSVADRKQQELPAVPAALVSEPEEYWEDEEEVDDQGYTTALSTRSHGENTTGGVTTVIMPKMTAKVKAELEAAKQMVESARTMEEIEDEAWDTSMVAEYGDEIFAYMRELEMKMQPNAHYMDVQTEIQWSMRSVLMDWLVQVHHRFGLLPETLFLCVNYIDRFLSCKIVSLGKLQLVGATAIFVAAKYEEINCPSVNEIVYMVDGGYTIDEILKAERFMLSMLQFELGWPGPMSFLRRISKADDYDLETRTLAKYFLEVTIMDERFVGCPPSYIAAGAHCLARLMLKKGDWTPSHVYYSGYTWTQLRPLVAMIKECCICPSKHHNAVYDKYKDRRYKRASHFVETEMQRGFVVPAAQPTRLSLAPYEHAGNMQSERRE